MSAREFLKIIYNYDILVVVLVYLNSQEILNLVMSYHICAGPHLSYKGGAAHFEKEDKLTKFGGAIKSGVLIER